MHTCNMISRLTSNIRTRCNDQKETSDSDEAVAEASGKSVERNQRVMKLNSNCVSEAQYDSAVGLKRLFRSSRWEALLHPDFDDLEKDNTNCNALRN